MKIATFNVNNINRRLSSLLEWLGEARPDIVCLQELKAANEGFPEQALLEAGYKAVWQGERTWNGVAILAKGTLPLVTRLTLPGNPEDRQSRYIEAAINGVLVASIYLPNGNPQPGPKFEYKLAWFQRLIRHAAKLYNTKAPVILAGDYNVVPTDADIYSLKSWKRDALLQPESRAAFQRLLKQGWVDALHMMYPNKSQFTFWDYFRNHWERDAGLRIDHVLMNKPAAALFSGAGVDRNVRGRPKPSDHAPVWITLQTEATAVGKRALSRKRRTLDGPVKRTKKSSKKKLS